MLAVQRFAPSVRTLMTSAVRQSGHDTGGILGSNLPFQVKNRYRLAVVMGLWLGSGFAMPFLLLRHQLKKK